VKAYLSKRAVRAAERIDARWRERADDPGIFARELLNSIELLEASSVSGAPDDPDSPHLGRPSRAWPQALIRTWLR
jgi:hypothetical protein